jgi:hypothetical protein
MLQSERAIPAWRLCLMNDSPHTITLTLTPEEEKLVAALAQERGLIAPGDVLRTLLHDAAHISDALWEKKFAESQDVLDRLADEGHAEYLAGQTEDFDPDSDPDAP